MLLSRCLRERKTLLSRCLRERKTLLSRCLRGRKTQCYSADVCVREKRNAGHPHHSLISEEISDRSPLCASQKYGLGRPRKIVHRAGTRRVLLFLCCFYAFLCCVYTVFLLLFCNSVRFLPFFLLLICSFLYIGRELGEFLLNCAFKMMDFAT